MPSHTISTFINFNERLEFILFFLYSLIIIREVSTLRFQGRLEKEAALNKMNDLQKSIDGWDGKNISQSCHEFLMGMFVR